CSPLFSSRRRHTRSKRDWSSDVCSSDLILFDDDKKYRKALKRIKNNNEIYREMISVSENKDVKDLNSEYYNIFVEGGGQVKGESLLEALKEAYLKSGGTIKYEEYNEKDDDFKNYATGAYGLEQ